MIDGIGAKSKSNWNTIVANHPYREGYENRKYSNSPDYADVGVDLERSKAFLRQEPLRNDIPELVVQYQRTGPGHRDFKLTNFKQLLKEQILPILSKKAPSADKPSDYERVQATLQRSDLYRGQTKPEDAGKSPFGVAWAEFKRQYFRAL